MSARILLALGGARSGKSALAERWATTLARAGGGRLTYVATARPWPSPEAEADADAEPEWDADMAARIAEHQARRGPPWRLTEWRGAPLPDILAAALSAPGDVALVDCLTLWLSWRLMAADAAGLPADLLAAEDAETRALLAAARAGPGAVIFVSSEVGLSVIPETRLGRRFRDAQGALNQRVAEAADHVAFVAAGLPLTLKGTAPK